MKPNKQVI